MTYAFDAIFVRGVLNNGISPANTAKAKHLREGFRDPSIQFDFHSTPYSILYHDNEEAIDRRIFELAVTGTGRKILEQIVANGRK